ncbi:uncharacterized protein LOC115432695 [Sphaeramia orbicularis]|uniref:uncharacterized protein LOC115432695 n=1 Tax=Sphaeramia orbicularis TaxID=375764 RepID=UPI00117F0955|nr:uncharacterized protein LOC115432695 [Sphaeramia orbicularis]
MILDPESGPLDPDEGSPARSVQSGVLCNRPILSHNRAKPGSFFVAVNGMRHFLRVRTCTVLDLVLILVLVLVLTADEASAQRSVHVSEGADAVLPCTYPGGPPPSDVSIYWKDKHDNQVLTIQNDKMDPRNQSPGYRNRTQSFPHQYKDGNFSLVLMKVDGSDAGLFECHIIPEGFQQNVRLNVTSKRGSPESGSSVWTWSGVIWTVRRQLGGVSTPPPPPPTAAVAVFVTEQQNHPVWKLRTEPPRKQPVQIQFNQLENTLGVPPTVEKEPLLLFHFHIYL